jgi:opine dehydrogenase
MKDLEFAVLGAGNVGQMMAADLRLGGYSVRLFEMEKFRPNIDPIIEKGGIDLIGIGLTPSRVGFAEINTVTTNMKEAVEGTDVINVCIPAYGHEALMNLLVPHLHDGQIVVVWPDNWGAVRLRRIMKEKGKEADIVVAGASSCLYGATRVTPTRVWNRRFKVNLRLAAFPTNGTQRVIETLSKPWPGHLIAGGNILEVTICNSNWIVHPGLMIFNTCRIESDKGMFNIQKEGGSDPSFGVTSPSKLSKKLETEIREVQQRLGLRTDYPPMYPPGHKRARLTEEELQEYAKINFPGKSWPSPDHAPSTLDHRYLTEDIPFGLVPVHHFGSLVSVPTPYIDACVYLCGLLNDRNYWKEGVTLEKLGWGNLTATQILKMLQ